MDFHHIYDKKYLIAHMANKGSLSKLMEELKKCVVLCSNCHRKVHAGLVKL